MRVIELLEGQLRRGFYDLGYHPTSRDRGLAHLYNNVIPALASTFKIPTANFQLQSDHGFGFQRSSRGKVYSTEKVLMKVILRKKSLDTDLIGTMLPRKLKAELSKQLTDVTVEVIEQKPEEMVWVGKDARVPPYLLLRFTAKYPQEWIAYDKSRYGFTA